MRVVVPYANWEYDPVAHRAMERNLQMQGVAAEWHPVGDYVSGDPFEYSRLFRALWSEGYDFIIVEHDVLPWQGFYQVLTECTSPWCGLNTSLQCTKFSPSALGECPVTEDVHWQAVDKCFWTLWDRGEKFCEHPPSPVNLTMQAL
ncbi:MAG: hypothetical protein V4510_12920 [bacterium]